VAYTTQNGTATAGVDYTAASGTLSFAAGETTKTVTVATIDDTAVESNETLRLVLSNPTGGNLGTAGAVATIVDNEGALFSIDGTATGVSFSEGVGSYTFTVHRNGLTTGTDTVVVSSGGGTATAGGDYTAVNQTLTFAVGETSKTVAVTVIDDTLVEGNETFNLHLGSASAGALIDPANTSVTATIQDNEVAVISIDNAAAGMSLARAWEPSPSASRAAASPATPSPWWCKAPAVRPAREGWTTPASTRPSLSRLARPPRP
jgi:hypothetical protein